MKKIIYKTTIALFLAIGLVSCDSELDQLPHDSLGSDQAYNTAQDFENAIRGTYRVFFNDGYYGGGDSGDLTTLSEVLADNVIRNPNGRGTKRTLYDYTFDAANAHMGIYSAAYNMIYRANLILHYLDENDFQGANRTQITAEARALRGIAHFDVVKYYGKIPTQGGELGLGIPYVTEADPNITPSRLGLLETYDRILEDIEFAYNNIDSSVKDGRLNKEALALYLSRIHLYIGGTEHNTKASQYASEVTTQPSSRDKLTDVFLDLDKSGLVFYISNLPGADGLDASIGNAWGQGSANGRTSEFNVTKSFYDIFEDEDIRKEAFIKVGRDNGGNQGAFVGKLWGKDGAYNGKVDLKILRAEEAILIKAEAEYKLGSEGVALAELDRLRELRYDNFTSGNETGNDLWEAIKLERRLEFAFEYSRFLDLKRWGEDLHRVDEGHQLDGTGLVPVKLDVENSNIRFVLPYSQGSMNRNSNTVQNPGYQS